MSLDRILLGMLKEPASGYELKAVFDGTVNYFWPAELSQIYRTLKRLEADGLLKSRVEASEKGPDRKVYSLTAAGRKALRAWLSEEPIFGDERLTYLAQLFFMGELGDPQRTLAFIRQLRRKRSESLAVYREIEREWLRDAGGSTDNVSDEEFHQYLALRSGLHTMAARVKWCDEVIKRIENRIKQPRKKRKGRTWSNKT